MFRSDAPDDHEDWVTVFESNDLFAIGLAKGLLEDAEVPFSMGGDETAARLVVGPIIFPTRRFVVQKERETEARELLAVLESPLDEGASGGAPADSGHEA